MLKMVLGSTVKARSRLISGFYFDIRSCYFHGKCSPRPTYGHPVASLPTARRWRGQRGGTARGHSHSRDTARKGHPAPTEPARAVTGFGVGSHYAKQRAAV